jgi:hypothetical protein
MAAGALSGMAGGALGSTLAGGRPMDNMLQHGMGGAMTGFMNSPMMSNMLSPQSQTAGTLAGPSLAAPTGAAPQAAAQPAAQAPAGFGQRFMQTAGRTMFPAAAAAMSNRPRFETDPATGRKRVFFGF